MRAAIALRNVVCERQYVFMVAVVPPHRHFHANAVLFADHIDRVGHHRGLRAVDIFDKLAHTAVVIHLGPQGFCRALIFQHDFHARIQERQFAQAHFQRFELEF